MQQKNSLVIFERSNSVTNVSKHAYAFCAMKHLILILKQHKFVSTYAMCQAMHQDHYYIRDLFEV